LQGTPKEAIRGSIEWWGSMLVRSHASRHKKVSWEHLKDPERKKKKKKKGNKKKISPDPLFWLSVAIFNKKDKENFTEIVSFISFLTMPALSRASWTQARSSWWGQSSCYSQTHGCTAPFAVPWEEVERSRRISMLCWRKKDLRTLLSKSTGHHRGRPPEQKDHWWKDLSLHEVLSAAGEWRQDQPQRSQSSWQSVGHFAFFGWNPRQIHQPAMDLVLVSTSLPEAKMSWTIRR